ncbi:MAG TPA: hypothetical protein ENK18_09525 [Deltaproteobacteria bacterium]|nr:hypothetical protein [Deltaproteobacteria bacterium]
MPDSLYWVDLGALSRADFVDTCQQQWDRERLSLSASDRSVALKECDDTQAAVDALSCQEIIALYAPTP